MLFSPQTYDTFWCESASRRRRATKKWISRGDFFRAKQKLRLYWFYNCFRFVEQCEKNEFVRSWHQEKGRLHRFMKQWGIRKKEQKNNNASRVRSEVFLMNFRIVKKTMGIYRKFENDEWWAQKVNFRAWEMEDIFWSQNSLSLYYI